MIVLLRQRQSSPILFPYSTLFRSDAQIGQLRGALRDAEIAINRNDADAAIRALAAAQRVAGGRHPLIRAATQDRKSTRLNSSHPSISYAVFCLKKKIDLIPASLLA